MTTAVSSPPGLRQLIERYRQAFRIPENMDHYSPADYRRAEKRFVKFCLENGCPAAVRIPGGDLLRDGG